MRLGPSEEVIGIDRLEHHSKYFEAMFGYFAFSLISTGPLET
jgi:hypothetical protein